MLRYVMVIVDLMGELARCEQSAGFVIPSGITTSILSQGAALGPRD